MGAEAVALGAPTGAPIANQMEQRGLGGRIYDGIASTRYMRSAVAVLAAIGIGEFDATGVASANSANEGTSPVATMSANTPECNTITTPFSTGGQTNNGKTETETCTSFTYRIGTSSMKESDVASGRFNILANGKGWSAAKIRRAERAGRCMMVGAGTKHSWFKNEGYNTSNTSEFGWDHRPTEICKDANGVWRKVLCNNRVIFTEIPPKHPVQTIFVRNMAKASLSVSATSESHAKASAICTDSYGYGEGSGSATGSAKVSIKALVKNHAYGTAKVQAGARISAEGSAKAQASSTAEAKAYCASSTSTSTGPGPNAVDHPPQVNEVGPQHVKVGGEIEICEYESDPDNNIVSRDFSETGNGNFISNVYPGNEAGEFCIRYKAGTQADTATVSIKVMDASNNVATDSETFPIDDSAQGEF